METAKNKNLSISHIQTAPLGLRLSEMTKRTVDILASLLGMLILSPLLGLLCILIKREGTGPVFYRGPRTGRRGREFNILKFRTMYEDASSYTGPHITAKGDQRITPLGGWLRDTKLNELPQLWNVFIGEMSLVGPRPEDPEIVKTWPADARDEILSMRPGITSPASIMYRREETLLTADNVMDVYFRDIVPDKLRLDRLYVRSHSFMGDLDVIFWTAVALIPIMARQQIPEGDLFVGPFYRFTQRYFSWFILDFLTSLLIIAAIGLTWRIFEPLDWGLNHLTFLAFGIAVFFSSVNVFLGLDHVYWSRAGADDGFFLAFSNGLSAVVLILLNSFLAHRPGLLSVPALPPEMLVLIGSFTMLGSLLTRYRLRLLTSFASRWLNWRGEKTGFGERVLILGAGEGGEIAHWLIGHGSLRHVFTVVGLVDDDLSKLGMRVNHSWVLGSSSELPDLIRKHDIGVVLFAITNISPEARERIIKLCRQSGARLIYVNELLGAIQTQLSPP